MKVLATIALAATIGTVSVQAVASNPQDPRPIGGGIQAQSPGAPTVHYYPLLPARQGVEFSTISDFAGVIGAAHVENMGTLTDKVSGKTMRVPFKTDLRFMQGNYVGQDGNVYWGTFAMVGLRLQLQHGGPDFHCFSPGVADTGLVFTIPMDPAGLNIDVPNGRVDMKIRNQPLGDFPSLNVALQNGPAQQATLKLLNAHWKTPLKAYSYQDNLQFFRGNFTETHAIAEFMIDAPTFTFKTDTDVSSHEDFAVVAQEWNGLYF